MEPLLKNRISKPILVSSLFIIFVDFYLNLNSRLLFNMEKLTMSPSLTKLFLTDLITVCFSHILLVGLFFFISLWLSLTFNLKKLWGFAAISSSYALLFSFVHYPQLFDNVPKWLTIKGLQAESLFIPLVVYIVILILLIGYLAIRKLKATGPGYASLNLLLCSIFSITLLVFNLRTITNSGELSVSPSFDATKGEPKPNIIVISLDTLNIDADQILYQYANQDLKDFLDHSVLSTKTIADVPQTHGSFVSIFSGERPTETGVRYPFHSSSTNFQQDSFRTLKALKERGYRINFFRDEMITAPFFPGNVIDEVVMGGGTEHSNRLGPYYVSILTYGIFDNLLGRILFPQAYDSAVFQFGHKPNTIARNFARYLDKVSKETSPAFVFFHSCSLHIPLNLPFPFYKANLAFKNEFAKYGYPNLFQLWTPQDISMIQATSENNIEVYNSGVKRITEEVLNPLFSYLKQNHSLSQSKILIISDHGENIWHRNRHLIGNFPLPFHGNSLLFGSTNEYSYFRYPRTGNPEVDKDANYINLSQQLRKHLGLDFDSSIAYSETGKNPFPDVSTFANYQSLKMISAASEVDSRTGALRSTGALLAPSVLEKQRAVYRGNLKLTYYRTIYGRNLFLCDLTKDPLCERNLAKESTFQVEKRYLLDKLNLFLSADERNGLDYPIEEMANGKNLQNNKWLAFHESTSKYFGRQNFSKANIELKQIYDTTTDPFLKTTIESHIKTRCLNFSPFESALANTMEKATTDRTTMTETFFNKSENFFCWSTAADLTNRSKNQNHLIWKFDPIENLASTYNFPEAKPFLEGVARKYGLPAQDKVTALYRLIPFESRNKEIDTFIAMIKDHYLYYFQYALRNELDPYFYLEYVLLNIKGVDAEKEIFYEIQRTPASAEFETRLFNSLEVRFSLPAVKYSETEDLDMRQVRIDRIKPFLH